MTTRYRLRAGVVSVLASGALLVGCSDDGSSSTSDDPASPSPSQSDTRSGSSSGSSSESPSESSSESPNQAGQSSNLDALVAAGETAMQEVDGSTVFSIEAENNGQEWEVQVVTSDGVEHEMRIAGDGSSVISGPGTGRHHSRHHGHGNPKNRARTARIDFAEAARTVAEAVGGKVVELQLDHHHGRTVWEGDVIDSSGTKYEINVDARSGDVISKSID